VRPRSAFALARFAVGRAGPSASVPLFGPMPAADPDANLADLPAGEPSERHRRGSIILTPYWSRFSPCVLLGKPAKEYFAADQDSANLLFDSSCHRSDYHGLVAGGTCCLSQRQRAGEEGRRRARLSTEQTHIVSLGVPSAIGCQRWADYARRHRQQPTLLLPTRQTRRAPTHQRSGSMRHACVETTGRPLPLAGITARLDSL
jgi:hypothetical protein